MSRIISIKVNQSWKISEMGCRSILMKAISDAGITTNNVMISPIKPNNEVMFISI